jgi:hypothetical protein
MDSVFYPILFLPNSTNVFVFRRVPIRRQCKTAENFKCALVRQEAETSLGLDFYAWAEASAGEAAALESKLGKVSNGDNAADGDDDDESESESDGKRRSSSKSAEGSKGSRRSQQKQSEMRTRAQTLRNDAHAYFQVPNGREASSTAPTMDNH